MGIVGSVYSPSKIVLLIKKDCVVKPIARKNKVNDRSILRVTYVFDLNEKSNIY